MSVVLRFQSTGAIPGDGRPVAMVGTSLTIGRGNENDLVLPDPDRVISSRHCAIEDQNGNVVVIDLSTNGTFLNYGKVPLGRVPTPLNDGDILSIGSYELAVDLSSARPARGGPELLDPLGSGPVAPQGATADNDLDGLLDSGSGGTDFIDDLLGEAPKGPKGIVRPELGEDGLLPPLGEEDAGDPLGAGPDPDSSMGASQSMSSPSVQDRMPLPQSSGAAIPDDWDLDLDVSPAGSEPPASQSGTDPFGEAPATSASEGAGGAAFIPDDLDFGLDDAEDESATIPQEAAPPPPPPPPPPSTPSATPPPLPESPSPPVAARPMEPGDAALLQAVLRAAGVPDMSVADDEAEQVAARLGNILRIMIHGMREILMTRSSIKSEFRIEQTRIAASGNNPLKFSITPEQAVEVMVSAPKRGYLSAEAAAEQALQDIKAHEVATMTGMEAALKGVLHRLSPQGLESQITDAGGLGGLLKGKKARYWETYEKIYADVADAAENDFHELFSREFARAYQEQLNKLKNEN